MKKHPVNYPRLRESIHEHLSMEASKLHPNADMILALCRLGKQVRKKIAAAQAAPETVGEDERK